MKKYLFLFVCMLNSLWASAQFSGSGSGTASDPYLIFNPTQLAQMANFLNNTSVVFELKNDLDLTEFIEENYPVEGWSPIGVKDAPFKGTLKGNSHTISGLTINRSNTDNVGLFGYTSSGSIQDLSIEDCIIVGKRNVGAVIGYNSGTQLSNINVTTQTPIQGSSYTGGICGYLTSSISNSTFVGSVTGGCTIGGIAGYASSTFRNCVVIGDVNSTGYWTNDNTGITGGICGYSSGASFYNCYCRGTVKAYASHVGGIYGNGSFGVMEDCMFFGDVSTKGDYAGGICATSSSGSMDDCACIGNVTGNKYVGGLIGYFYGSHVKNSYFSGDVVGTEDVGGLLGYGNTSMTYCYSYANVRGNKNVGGLVGDARGTIKSNMAMNSVVCATQSNVGRIYGYSSSTLSIGALGTVDCNISINKTNVILAGVLQTITDDLQNGSSIGQAMLKLKATYVAKGWNFDSNWTIQETDSYPYLNYQAAPPVILSELLSGATSIQGKSINGGTVYLYYKDDNSQVYECKGDNNWAFETAALQSGAEVRLFTDTEGMRPSYFTTASVHFPGNGTASNPYEIYTADDLRGVSKSGYYKLMNDIDVTSWIAENSPQKGWISIGHDVTDATHIDGNGHKITGLWANTTDSYTGLFSSFSSGSIKNLTVEVAKGRRMRGGDYTGVLVGRNANGVIQNVIVRGDVEGTKYVGGLMGYSYANTINSVNYVGRLNSTSSGVYIGGIAGYAENNEATVCRLQTTINSTGSDSRVGGAFGESTGGTVRKVLAECNISATGENNWVGGLMGYGGMSITQSLSTGTVKATGAGSYSGGLVGYAVSSIANCYSTVATTGTDFTGGLVAYTLNTIDKCYTMGDATGVLNGAGVVAQLDGASAKVRNSVAVNNKLTFTDQSSWASRVIGGYKNGAADPDNSNYALKTMQVTLNGVATKKYDDLVEGIAKEQSELQSATFYQSLGWDFENVWGIEDGQAYPFLLWEVDVNPVVEITLDKTTAVVAAGNTLTLTPNIQPLGATNKRLAWTSSNEDVATVEDGVVTAVAIGEAIITATSTDGSGVSATCKVTVVANHDEAIAQLREDVEAALALYSNSTEGSNIGQYAAGSRAALLKVINEVRALISDTMEEAAISDCSSMLAQAVADFKAKKVTGGADTDITLLDNVIYIEPVTSGCGKQLTLSVKMKNNVAFTGYKFDLYLPDGCTFATDEDGFPLAALSTERTTVAKTNYFDSSFPDDGKFLRVLCYSSKGYSFSGNDGEIATVTINIPADMEAGDYALVLRDIELALGSESYDTDYVKSTLTVSTYKLGDANDDGKIGVADLTAIASHILGTTPAHFVLAAADANEDGKIGVADLTCIAAWILNGTASNRRAPAAASVESMSVELGDFTIVPGGTAVVPVSITNGMGLFSGYQFDVRLPEGFHVVSASLAEDRLSAVAQTFDAALIDENTARVLCYSPKNMTFAGTSGIVAYLTIAADNDVVSGLYSAELGDAEISYYASSIEPATSGAAINVTLPTDITNIDFMPGQTPVYDINGRRVNTTNLAKGLYIINGQKIIK